MLQKLREKRSGALRIVAPMLSRIANFDDADPLIQEPTVAFQWVPPGDQKGGAKSANGRIEGSYIHGLFSNDDYRRDWIQRAGADVQNSVIYQGSVEAAIDEFADAMESDLNIDALLACAARNST